MAITAAERLFTGMRHFEGMDKPQIEMRSLQDADFSLFIPICITQMAFVRRISRLKRKKAEKQLAANDDGPGGGTVSARQNGLHFTEFCVE